MNLEINCHVSTYGNIEIKNAKKNIKFEVYKKIIYKSIIYKSDINPP